ncbi:MAG TPA: M20/M25/M40 family metallo-hydrolase [Vicinamibacterales bacterium]|nr:M20/M25/M40 family metallo-hydrolase [Vicinamibacterales bacterium]
MLARWFAPALVFTLAAAYPSAQNTAERIDTEVNARIRMEGINRSQIMRTMHYLTDVYGPRLTGSPNHENAAKWAIEHMAEWGLVNGRLEPFEFKTATVTPAGGWLNERASGHIVAPVKDNLVFEVLAWTPSTPGTVTGPVVPLITPQGPEAPAGRGAAAQRLGPTEAELRAYLAELAPRVKGAMVFVGAHTSVPFQETPPAKRQTDEQARARYGGAPAGAGRAAGPGGPEPARGGGPPAGPPPTGGGGPAAGPARLTAAQVADIVNQFLVTSGAAVRVNDAAREHGQIRAFSFSGYDSSKTVPTVVLRNEDYGRITRLVNDGRPVTLEFTIVNHDYPAGKTSYNAIAEIRGSDKADEVVMLGGHLDSWHSATGATDNAIGCAVMMEAARILSAIGVKPRRTIRVALWGGEEQGLLGSKAYVEQHFGTAENPKPAFAKFAGYLNVDSGTGRIRGGTVFGPPAAAAILAQYFKPFEDLGVMGATATSSRVASGTDSTSFNAAGLPGIGLGQDGIEYQSHTWHTNLDTLERIVETDVKRSAVAIASAVYHLAMREELLPRLVGGAMPPAPVAAGRTGGSGQ